MARASRLGQLELAHEHLVQAQDIRAIFGHHVVGVDAVELGLGHLVHGHFQFLARGLQDGVVAAQLDLRHLVIAAQALRDTSRRGTVPGGATS